jgi:hypothetical protein
MGDMADYMNDMMLDTLYGTQEEYYHDINNSLEHYKSINKSVKMTKKERLNDLYKTYNLDNEDYFKHPTQGFTILTRSGIDKIQAGAEISIHYDLIHHSPDLKTAVIKAKAFMGSKQIETYGEVSPDNNKNKYPIAIAEKRAMSRAVLKLSGFYECGAFGEDEADDFKKPKKKQREVLDEYHGKYEGFCQMLRDGQITLNDLHKEYEIPATVEYKLDECARG